MSADKWCARTDLALETQESLKKANTDMRGVNFSEKKLDNGIIVSVVTIDSENAVRATGRPKGKYVTIEAAMLSEGDEECCQAVTRELSRELKSFVKAVCDKRIYAALVVGLGNRNVTPDALGPRCVDSLFIPRHIVKEYGRYAFSNENVNSVCGLVPGVMAQTGMETLEIIRGIVEQTHPTALVVVDALAARNTKRLNRTIQISDAGIHPGSGVGNHRQALTKETLGVPVIAIGVPTVVDAATIAADTMETLVEAMSQAESLKNLGYTLSQLDSAEKYQLIRELISPQLNGMFVTPKDIDETVKRISFTISEGINLALKAG